MRSGLTRPGLDDMTSSDYRFYVTIEDDPTYKQVLTGLHLTLRLLIHMSQWFPAAQQRVSVSAARPPCLVAAVYNLVLDWHSDRFTPVWSCQIDHHLFVCQSQIWVTLLGLPLDYSLMLDYDVPLTECVILNYRHFRHNQTSLNKTNPLVAMF